MKELITPSQAENLITESLVPLSSETVPLEQSLHRVLRQPLTADRPFPPFDRVTMDGIAFCSAHTSSRTLQVHGLHPAGAPSPPPLPPGSCWQIMTGATLPADCDTVIPYEEITLSPDQLQAHISPTFQPISGKFIHRQASDAPSGALLIPEFTKLTPGHLGLAASIGATTLQVTCQPRIEILTTGDELVPIEATPASHQLRRSNGLTLQMAIRSTTALEATTTHIQDDLTETTRQIKESLSRTDVIVLSGGISKGKKDYVRPALESLIGAPLFHGVSQRPGKPLAYWPAKNDHPAVFALPGNPNSTLTTCHRYLIPALRILSGELSPPQIILPLTHPSPAHPSLTQLLPAKLNPEGKLILLQPQNSGDFLTPLTATYLIEIPPGPPQNQARIFPL